MKKILIAVLILIFVSTSLRIKSTNAAVSACTATVSPTTITNYSSNNFTFSIQNTGTPSYQWIKITRPSSYFSISGGGVSGGWSMSSSESSITLTNQTLSNGQILNVAATVDTPTSNTASSENWIIQVSDSSDGSDPFTCTGTLGTEITGGGTDTFEPVITNVAIGTANDTSVIVTWNTDENASSNIDYGTTTAYGSTVSDTALTTSHSLTITGLTKNTSYHSTVYSTDASGNTGYSSDFTFNTSSSQTTVTTTTTETKTVTKLVEDTEKPGISFTTSFDEPFSSVPTIYGKVTDNAGIALVEYSSDGGENWLPVDETTGLQSKTVNFNFSLFGLLDGNYRIRVRATDLSANVYTTSDNILVFDRLPPSIGAVIYSLGSQILTPENNSLKLISGVDVGINLSAVGGPTDITLSAIKGGPQEFIGEFVLSKNPDTGLWSGYINLVDPGTYILQALSVDGAGNEVISKLGNLNILPKGSITFKARAVNDATLIVYYWESSTDRFVVWDGEAYGQKNPVNIDNNGGYSIILPKGKYYLKVDALGFSSQNTSIFEIGKTTPINLKLNLEVQKRFYIGNNGFSLPALFQPELLVYGLENSIDIEESTNNLIGQEFPTFELESEGQIFDSFYFRGRPTVYSFVNTWFPKTTDQINQLEMLSSESVNVVFIFPQESLSKVRIYKSIGKYDSLMLADPDGILFEKFNQRELPLNILVDRRGVIKDIVNGVIDEENVLRELINN